MTRRERLAQGDYKLVLNSSDMSDLIEYSILYSAIKDDDSIFLGAESTTSDLLGEFEDNIKFDCEEIWANIYDDKGNFHNDHARFTMFQCEKKNLIKCF